MMMMMMVIHVKCCADPVSLLGCIFIAFVTILFIAVAYLFIYFVLSYKIMK